MGSAALRHGALSPLRQAPFRRYLLGLTGDLVGDQIWFIALAWLASEVADAAVAGLVVAVATLPRLILLVPAGVLVDRLGALRMAQGAQAVRVMTMAVAVMVSMLGNPGVPVLMGLALVFGLADAGRLPAAASLPPAILEGHDLPGGQGFVSIAGRIASVASGPAVAAALAVGGFGAAAAFNVGLFALAFVAFRGLRSHLRVAPDKPGESAGLRAGLLYIARRKYLWLLLAVVAGVNLALVGALNLGVVLRIREESWDLATLGWIFGSFGLAAALGALAAATVPVRSPVVWGLGWSAMNAMAIGSLGLTSDFTGTMLLVAIAGFTVGPAGALLIGAVQATTDRAYLGRVMSVMGLATYGVAPIALGGFGFLVELIGLDTAFVVTGLAAAMLAVVGMTAPSLRSVTLNPALNQGV